MVFTPPAWVPQLPIDPPDSITIAEFMSNETYGRYPIVKSRNPYTCGLTGKTYSAAEVIEREHCLARGIGQALGFDPYDGSEWDRVVAIFSLNTIDYISVTHAIHRLNGIVTPASAVYSTSELEHQLRYSGAKALFTCVPLLPVALKAADAAGIPRDNIFILPMPKAGTMLPYKTVDDLINAGRGLPKLPPLKWSQGQGSRQVAFLCYSSGTSGLPKAVMISHRNVIANILQKRTFESIPRKSQGVDTQVILGLLPFSHIYGLVLITHVSAFRGDEVIVQPRFELERCLAAIAQFKIQQLNLVPPILIQMLKNQEKCRKYDLSSVRFVYTGAAPLGRETAEDLMSIYPKWHIGQGYGLTETATVVTSTSELDILIGSTGSLVPGTKAKIIDSQGSEVTDYDVPGELFVQSPSVVLGYLNSEKATAETFVWHDDGRWMRTGDEVVVRKSPAGNEHFFIVDRIKELIKVKGHQVAPAELEAHLLTHPYVADCAVIQVPHESSGEVPKAFVVKSEEARSKVDTDVVEDICKHVENHKARHKWLKGGVEFVDSIPKSATGKILRRLLRDREKQARNAKKEKL
ncbi:AMP-binding enzyme [Ilyonectria robusta]|uniref:AMP-binding enzyme n=1 Tax=Ilyonectria robusta TaxID=1079257 RepID=UPI001E8DBD10|nr:AMP-binding enzyme [Ilyonectria robusta]KAH8663346.1 AMP-binding enzyme [Ilyonectria robusta]